jgi:hypothetical protein
MSGYSGTPLAKKLGIKEGFRILSRNAPENYESLLALLPDGVHLSTNASKDSQMVHFFAQSRRELKSQHQEHSAGRNDLGLVAEEIIESPYGHY